MGGSTQTQINFDPLSQQPDQKPTQLQAPVNELQSLFDAPSFSYQP